MTAGTMRQPLDQCCDQTISHRGDRVWTMPFRSCRQCPAAGNLGVGEELGTVVGCLLQRGKKPPVRRPENRRRRGTRWRDGESRATLFLQSGRDPSLASIPIVTLHAPTLFRLLDQRPQGAILRQRAQPVLGWFRLALRPLDQEPFFRTDPPAPVTPMCAPDTYPAKPR